MLAVWFRVCFYLSKLFKLFWFYYNIFSFLGVVSVEFYFISSQAGDEIPFKGGVYCLLVYDDSYSY